MNSIMLRVRNFFQWSVCALVLILSVGEGFADLRIYDNVDLTNGDLEMPARLVPLPPEQTRIHEGMLDVTKAPYFADNTGATDARAAIQNAMDDAYKANLVTFFPSGTYLCSDTLTGYQGWNQGFRGQQKFTYKLVGSTQGSRPVLKLMDNATLSYVGDAGDYPIFIHMTWRDLVNSVMEEHGERGYGLEFRGIDIDMGNNPNASALAMQGAQHSIIQDVHVYGTAFAYGIDGIPGGGGFAANLKVTGGKVGVITGRTMPTIVGLTLENQSEIGLKGAGIGPTVVAGFSIKGPDNPLPGYRAVYVNNTQSGFKEGYVNLVMVDGTIEVPVSTEAAIYSYDQDVHLQNVYVKAAKIIESGVRFAPSEVLSGNANSWKQVRRYACRGGNDSAALVIDGVNLGTPGNDYVHYEPLLTVAAPPTNLISQHWDATIPSWEDPDRVSITDFGAIPENNPGSAYDNAPSIQAALDSTTTVGSTNYGKTVFIPRGVFNISSPIMVPDGAKLVGAANVYSQLDVSSDWAPTSATSILTTEDSPTAKVVLAHFLLHGWEPTDADVASGRPATTAQEFLRYVTVQSGNTLWRDVQINMRQGITNRRETEPYIVIENNGGGRFFNAQQPGGGTDNQWAPNYPTATFCNLRIAGTTLPVSLYHPNYGKLNLNGVVRLENCNDVRIYGWKCEQNNDDLALPPSRALDVTDVNHFIFFGNEGIYNHTDAGYVVLNGQCSDVRIANLSRRIKETLPGAYTHDFLTDYGNGFSVPDRPSMALYAKDAPQLRLYDGATISDPELFNGSTGADFGSAPGTKVFTIYNGGFADLTNLLVTVDGVHSNDFVVGAPVSTTVSPGGSTTFTITFSPLAGGIRTATAHIASNDPSGDFDVSLVGSTIGSQLPILDSAFVKGGANADTPQAWTDGLLYKNPSNLSNNRIAMMKIDGSNISGAVDSATLIVTHDDNNPHTLYVYGVADSASFQDWTGGEFGSATWNSVTTNGLFTPKYNLHSLGDPNLTLLDSQEFFGLNSDVSITITNQAIVDFLNTDTDGLVTLVFCMDLTGTVSIRPHTHVNAPTLMVNHAPAFDSDPISRPSVLDGTSYSGTLAGSATDGDAGEALTYSKISGPDWLIVSPDGSLSGTPGPSDVGTVPFTVKVQDAALASDTATLHITVGSTMAVNAALPILDSAFVNGLDADTPQSWTEELVLKKNNRMAMIKVDVSGISGAVASATLTVYDTDTKVHSLRVYGVKDSASFQNWTGNDTGNATWNSVMTNGLFTPVADLYAQGDANLTLLGSQALTNSGSDTAVTVSGQALIDFLNTDTDGLVTFVFCTDLNSQTQIRPHTHANAPTLEYVYHVPNITYDYWLSDHRAWLGSETNKNDNKDGDSFNNMAEYALGGNPKNGTDTAILPFAQMMQAGGTNYIEYVHLRRKNADSLEYRVEVTTNLITGIWTNTLVQIIGTNTASGVDGFDAVTNRVPAGPKQQFIHLKIK